MTNLLTVQNSYLIWRNEHEVIKTCTALRACRASHSGVAGDGVWREPGIPYTVSRKHNTWHTLLYSICCADCNIHKKAQSQTVCQRPYNRYFDKRIVFSGVFLLLFLFVQSSVIILFRHGNIYSYAGKHRQASVLSVLRRCLRQIKTKRSGGRGAQKPLYGISSSPTGLEALPGIAF